MLIVKWLHEANSNVEEGLSRGWRDMISKNPLKTEMKNRIKEELIEPLKDYIANEPTIKEGDKAELLSQLKGIEQNHLPSIARN